MLTDCLALLSRLKDFENQFPQRSGLLHGDLHFGNVIWDGYKPIPIDFDDCGIGLHMYDLTIYLRSVKNQLSNRKQENQGAAYLEAMVDGYNSIGSLDKVDLELLPYLRLARSLTMFAWCYSRKDIEYIYEHFKKNKSKWIKQFQKFLTEGPERFFT